MLGPRPTGDEDIDFLSLLSDGNRRRVLEGSTKEEYPAGSIAFHPEGPERPFVLERGLARVYTSVPDGRQATVTFVHRNELCWWNRDREPSAQGLHPGRHQFDADDPRP